MSITYKEAREKSIKELHQEFDKEAGDKGLEIPQIRSEIQYREQCKTNKLILWMTIMITICTILNIIYIFLNIKFSIIELLWGVSIK